MGKFLPSVSLSIKMGFENSTEQYFEGELWKNFAYEQCEKMDVKCASITEGLKKFSKVKLRWSISKNDLENDKSPLIYAYLSVLYFIPIWASPSAFFGHFLCECGFLKTTYHIMLFLSFQWKGRKFSNFRTLQSWDSSMLGCFWINKIEILDYPFPILDEDGARWQE